LVERRDINYGNIPIIQTVADKGKVNLRMFPTRKYKNCRNWSKQIVIDTYVVTQQMRNDKIRHVVYNVYVQL